MAIEYFNVTFDDHGLAIPSDQLRIRRFESAIANDPTMGDMEKSNMLESFYKRNRLIPGTYNLDDYHDNSTTSRIGDSSSGINAAVLFLIITFGVMGIADLILRKMGFHISLLQTTNDLFWDGVGLLITGGGAVIHWMLH